MKKDLLYAEWALTLFMVLIIVFIIVPKLRTPNADSAIENFVNPEETWLNSSLTDSVTQEKFTIENLLGNDKPVLIESFAVWCPTCTRQQEEIKKLHEDPEFKDSFTSVSIDTDPNEDASLVVSHLEEHGFNWPYIVSPINFTESLIDQFGIDIVNAPTAPIILVCDSARSRQLDSGIKYKEELKQALASCKQ